MNIAGSIALVTGANRGIGAAFARALVARGAAKVYLAARDTASLAELLGESDAFVALELDVTDAAQVARAADIATDITILVNNAGTAAFTGVLSTDSAANARREMEVNYFGTLQMAQAFRHTPAFRAGGAIVNVLSMLSNVTLPVAGTYSASKAAALFLTRTLRAELKARGAQVLAVMPVQVETEMGAALPEPRLTPEVVAGETLDAIEAGVEDVYPGELTRNMANAFQANPAGVQAHMAGMVHAID